MRPPRLLAFALCLCSWSAFSAGQETPAPLLNAMEREGATDLRVGAGPSFHQTTAEVLDPRAIAIPGGAGVVALWSEVNQGRALPHYAIDVRGEGFARVRETSYELHTKRARFDPLAGAPDLAGSLLGNAGELHIVQFVCPPLQPFLDELRAMGAEVHHYLPLHARIVRMKATLLPEVAALPYVRWIGPYHPEYRLEPFLLEHLSGPEPRPALHCYVQVLEKGPAQKALVASRIEALGGRIEALIPDGYRLEATLAPEALIAVAQMDEVLWIDRWSPPEDDLNHVRSVGGANALETATGFSGTGVRGEVMDGNVRQTHVAFQANPILMHGPASGSSRHGTNTTGCIFGDGTAQSSARGVLPQGQPIFADYGHLSNRYTHTQRLLQSPYFAVFQSNSWGSSLTTQYNSTSMEMDDILFDFDIVILQSQSNAGSQSSRPQAWAKNVLSIGAVYHQNTANLSDDTWSGSASIGPAADGRIKPDLCFWYDGIQTTDSDSDTDYTSSFGGTSAATPCTAGFLGLVQQMWSDGVFGNTPSGATVFERRAKATTARALLVNSARQYPFSGSGHDLTRTHTGWGLPDVAALYAAREKLFVVDEERLLKHSETATYFLAVAEGEPAFRATLCYLDLPGTTSSALHRINDLSLRVTSPGGTQYWGNNGLSTGNWSTPGGSSNTRDVIENVFVQNPEAGIWTVEVIADELNGDGHTETGELDADFALVVSGVSRANDPCPLPTNYCSAKPTSQGALPMIGAANTPSVSSGDFHVTLTFGVSSQPALLFRGEAPAQTPFQGGTLCVQSPVERLAIVQLDFLGDAIWQVDLSASTPGDTQYYQVWFRDPPDPMGFGVGLSDGLEVTYCD